MNNKKLSTSNNRKLLGVCAGIAEFIDWPPSKVRLLWLLLAFFSGGALILPYIICAVVFPKPPAPFDLNNFRQQ